jgi:hypothetical protein
LLTVGNSQPVGSASTFAVNMSQLPR